MTTFAITGLQLSLSAEDNMARLERAIGVAMARFPWTQMIVLGELAPFGPLAIAAQTLPGPAEDQFRRIAERHEIWLINGSMYEKRGERIYNTTSVIDPGGEVVGRYRKMFPFKPYEKGIEPGTEFLVFDVPNVGKFGLSICYDMWFPETTRTLAWMGAEVIIHPTLTNTMDRDVEVAMCRASAAQNQCYFIDINSAAPMAHGRSSVVDPHGVVLWQAGDNEETMPIEVDFERVRQSRERGLLGLGQPLKSFRDCKIAFPPYQQGTGDSLALRSLGKLEMPPKRTPSPTR